MAHARVVLRAVGFIGITFVKLAIIGSRGFIGQHLTQHLLGETSHSLILVSRRQASPAHAERAVTRVADLLDSRSVTDAVADADVVINLASPSDAPPAVWAGALAGALGATGARRLVHCSTAVLVGTTPDAFVDETTIPRPLTTYERAKLEAEKQLAVDLPAHVGLVVARPTVVFGAGGHNLVSLAAGLMRRDAFRDLLRRALFGDRPMHLVPVGTVARALAFMVDRDLPSRSVLQIAADDDRDNTYRAVECRLRTGLGLEPPPQRSVVLPSAVLHTALRLRGRSDFHPQRRYSSGALRALGFTGGESVGDAVEEFGKWFAEQGKRPPDLPGRNREPRGR